MLLKYLTATLGVPADAVDFDALTATNVTGYLSHLEQERGNSTKTRNTRLTAIRSVLARALPDHLCCVIQTEIYIANSDTPRPATARYPTLLDTSFPDGRLQRSDVGRRRRHRKC